MMKHAKGLAVFAGYYLILKVVVAPFANPILAKVSPKNAAGAALIQL